MSPSGSLSHPVSPPSPRLGRSPSESLPTELPHEGASTLGSRRLCPALPGNKPPLGAPAGSVLGFGYTLHLGTQDPTPRRSRVGRHAGVLWPEPPREVANCCQHVERDAPLQTAARTGVVFSLLSVPCPPAACVSACVPPMPQLGGVYHCTNSSSDLPPSLEGAPRWRASGRAVRAGRWVSGKLQGGLGSGGGGRGTAEQHQCVSRSGSVGAGTEVGCKLELAGGALIWRVGVTLEPVEPVGCRSADTEVLFPSQDRRGGAPMKAPPFWGSRKNTESRPLLARGPSSRPRRGPAGHWA